jgi:hypothetical protein
VLCGPFAIDDHKMFSEGAYRQVVTLDHSYAQEQEKIILKDIQYG